MPTPISSPGPGRPKLVLRERTIEVNGISTHYVEAGHGPPIVFLHGIGLDLRYWRPQMEFFAPGYRTIAYDLRAHGESGGKSHRFKFVDWLHDLHDFLRQLKIDKPILCGHSLGGVLALEYAITYPDRVAALVVADAPSPINRVMNYLGYVGQRIGLLLSRIFWPVSPLAFLARSTQTVLYSQAFQRSFPETMAEFRREYKRLSVRALINSNRALVRRHNNTAHLCRIGVPTLLMRGSLDKVVSPREMLTYRHYIPHSQLHLLEGSGHMTLQEQAPRFNDLMDRFLLGRLRETRVWAKPLALRLAWGPLLKAALLAVPLFALVYWLLGLGDPWALVAPELLANRPIWRGVASGLTIFLGSLLYGLTWALLFEPMRSWRAAVGGLAYALTATAVSLAVRPGLASFSPALAGGRFVCLAAVTAVFVLLYRPTGEED